MRGASIQLNMGFPETSRQCAPVPVCVLEGAAVGRVRQPGVVQVGEELQIGKLFQLEGRLCAQPLESTEDGVRQGAEGSQGDVPAGTGSRQGRI